MCMQHASTMKWNQFSFRCCNFFFSFFLSRVRIKCVSVCEASLRGHECTWYVLLVSILHILEFDSRAYDEISHTKNSFECIHFPCREQSGKRVHRQGSNRVAFYLYFSLVSFITIIIFILCISFYFSLLFASYCVAAVRRHRCSVRACMRVCVCAFEIETAVLCTTLNCMRWHRLRVRMRPLECSIIIVD